MRKALFLMLDNDNDGFLSVNDFIMFCTHENSLLSDFLQIDSDKNGLINFEEFSQALQ